MSTTEEVKSEGSQEEFNELFQLRWSDLTVQQDGHPILNNVSGLVLPGQHLVILGPSGSGKTTLLNHLSNKHAHKEHIWTKTGAPEGQQRTGMIFINGKDKDMIVNSEDYISYMRQDGDIFDESKNPL